MGDGCLLNVSPLGKDGHSLALALALALAGGGRHVPTTPSLCCGTATVGCNWSIKRRFASKMYKVFHIMHIIMVAGAEGSHLAISMATSKGSFPPGWSKTIARRTEFLGFRHRKMTVKMSKKTKPQVSALGLSDGDCRGRKRSLMHTALPSGLS